MKLIYVAILFLSVQIQLSAGVSNTSPNQSSAFCGVRTRDVASKTTGMEVQDVIAKYVANPNCNLKLRVAIGSIFMEEHRDDDWAGPLERIIQEAAQARGAKMTGVCHTSLCRYDIELPPSEDSTKSPHEVEHRVISDTSGTPFQVASLRYYGSNLKFTIYFYSTVRPAAFLEPLRRKMEEAN